MAVERTESEAKLIEALTEQQIQEYREAFKLFDKNGDNSLTAKELCDIMNSNGINCSLAEAEAMVQQVDADNSHSIDFPEFLTMMARQFKTLDTANDLLAAFKVFDPYHKGVIPVPDFRRTMTSLATPLKDEELLEVLHAADHGDGLIHYEDLVKLLLEH